MNQTRNEMIRELSYELFQNGNTFFPFWLEKSEYQDVWAEINHLREGHGFIIYYNKTSEGIHAKLTDYVDPMQKKNRLPTLTEIRENQRKDYE